MEEEILTGPQLVTKFPILGSTMNLVRMRARGNGPPHYQIGFVTKYKVHEVEAWIEGKRSG